MSTTELCSIPEAAEPYHVRLQKAADDMLRAGRLREWRRLAEARSEITRLWREYDFVAAPIKGLAEHFVPKLIQAPLFDEGAA